LAVLKQVIEQCITLHRVGHSSFLMVFVVVLYLAPDTVNCTLPSYRGREVTF